MERDPTPLTPRLAAVAGAVGTGRRVADIGTDHGKLPLWLAATGRAELCLATETTVARLAAAIRPGPGASWRNRLIHRVGDGLSAIRPGDRIDTVVLAGLGGRTMVRILDPRALRSLGPIRLVLQPRSEVPLVRRSLADDGWGLDSETLTEEGGRAYVTIAARRPADDGLYRHTTLSRDDLLAAGPLLIRAGGAEVLRYWRSQRDRLAAIASRRGRGLAPPRLRRELERAERIVEAISGRA